MTADRHDNGKPQLHYSDIFDVADEGTARVAEYGASKYSPYNFMKGAKGSLESYNCARRHMKKWLTGVDYDEEAAAKGWQLHHIDLAIWNLKRLRQELTTYPERDNRPHIVLRQQEACKELTQITEELGGYENEPRDTDRAQESKNRDSDRLRASGGSTAGCSGEPQTAREPAPAAEESAQGAAGAAWARAFYAGER